MKDRSIIKECYKCKSTHLKPKKNLVTLGNKFTEIKVMECQKCGETYSTMNDAELARKALNPSILSRISIWFNSLTKSPKNISMFKDRIL